MVSRRPGIVDIDKSGFTKRSSEWAAVIVLAIALSSVVALAASPLQSGFVYLRDVEPTILQDIRYARAHNFVGKPISGYEAAECVLTERAAKALVLVQAALAQSELSLIVWDCYRPARAVQEFIRWVSASGDTLMKNEFYPDFDKGQSFAAGYLASRSAHSRGSTVDIGIVPIGLKAPPQRAKDEPLKPCTAPKGDRFEDGTIDLGTGYDCFDERARFDSPLINVKARANRALLRSLMVTNGFRPLEREWWHFELIDDPFPSRIFDFSIRPRP